MRGQPELTTSGFHTSFTFQVSGHSTRCTQVKDRSFTAAEYQTCAITAGDGFAFVVHADERGAAAVGAGAAELGYGGLANTLAVEFDTWYNAEPAAGDVPVDHISVHVAPRGGRITAASTARISPVVPANISDGLIHTARISYFPYIKYDLVQHFVATDELLPLLLDGGDGRRMGTLAVWLDDTVEPVLAMPLTLSMALALPDDRAYVGFTAATGDSWAKHDLLDWYWCTAPASNCTVLWGDRDLLAFVPGR